MKKSLVFLLFALVSVSGLIAQTSQGRILGFVTDPAGAAIPGAQVTITNTAKQTSRTLTTTRAGEFLAPELEPGAYVVEVSAAGFERYRRTGLELEVARDIRVDVQMKIGAVSQTVTVSEQAPVINTSNDVLGTTFSNVAINELPLQGRDFQNLVTLEPGIQREPGGGFLTITANGNRATDNNFIVDGIDDNDAYYGETVINEPGVTGTPATHLPIDAIQEFNIQSSPEADYGYKPGAVINLGIKSGTNGPHGSVYYFNRNSAFDARNYFDPSPAPVSALKLNQYGASIGGPIFKDKLFYFANYEGVVDTVGNPLQINTPLTVASPADSSESLPDAVGRCMAANDCSQLSLNLLPYFLMNPGGTATNDPNNLSLINTDYNNQNHENNGIFKLDYHATDRNSFNGTYFYGTSKQAEEDVNVVQPYWLSNANTTAQVVGGSWLFVANQRLTNQVHVGYNRLWQTLFQGDHNVDPLSYGLNTGVTNPLDFGMPEIRISGFVSHTLGGNVDYPLLTTPNSTYIISDNASYLRGSHNFRFGGEFRAGSTNNTRDDYGPGEVRFSSVDDFVTGNASRGYAWIGNSNRQVSQKTFGFFMQDNWHAGKKLTVSYGLRYDVSLPIKEAHNMLGNFSPTAGLQQVGVNISQPYKTDWNNLGPRLSFVYDTHGDGRTILRAGGGVIYEVPHISVFIGQNGAEAEGLATIPTGASLNGVPGPGNIKASFVEFSGTTTAANWQGGGPVFGNLDPNQISCSYDLGSGDGTPCPILGVDPNLVVPYVINWNANLEQALWKNAGLTVAYVGNKGNKLYAIRELNQNNYSVDMMNNDDEQSGRPFVNQFPYLSYIDQMQNGDNSIYHGLQVTLKQATTNGLFFVAGYTWAHSIDDASSNRAYTIQNSLNPAAERGDADSDIRNRFTLAMTYEPRGLPGHAQLLSGWRFNTIITAQSGEPILLYDSSNDISGTGEYNDRWNITGNPQDIHWSVTQSLPFFEDGTTNPACVAADPGGISNGQLAYYGCYQGPGYVLTPPQPGEFGNMGRNVVRGPDFVNADFSLIKMFHFHERYTMELRGEVFNILNHPNFAGVDGDLSDTATVGLAQYTPDVFASNPVIGSGGSRHIQLGAKLRF